jgi:hypothetical protein
LLKKVVNTVKKSFISLDTPPEPSSVVVVKRKYSSLARDLNYKKRVTWFDLSPELPVAVVEYIGSYPTNTNVHGNAKHISAPYRRTTTQQKTAIREGLKNNKPPKEIRREVNKANPDSVLGPRVVHDANKKDNPENIRSANVADEILSVLNKFNGSPYIREVITTNPQKPPAVICYTDEQLKLMKNAIVNGCIIGLDRTFNVSSCYITVVCFKNKNVIKKNTPEPPIMLGPIFMHWDGNFETYHRFISHLQIKLSDVQHHNIVLAQTRRQQ